ncbi:MAG TPA: YIP1 family protein [Ktedonobacteraceae bacterium]|nr:YIP1 family protein [Ktedonobacteraceae bacterium]
MAYYPDPNQPQPAYPGQQSGPYGFPVAQAQPSPYPGISPQSWQPVQQRAQNYRPFVLALLAFPFLSLKMFVWPGPTTFAKEKDRAGWKAILFLLLVGGAVTGLLAYLWGRFPRLTPGIENLGAGRVVPQPLSTGICLTLAVGVPLLFLILEGVLYLAAKKRGGQQSSFRAQLYSGLLIEAPLFAFLVVIALVLLYQPELGSSARLLFIGIAGAFLLYSFLLHVFAVMAVHQVGLGKAMLCVALMVVLLAVVVVALMAAGENSGDKSESRSHGSGEAHKGESQRDRSSDDSKFDFDGSDGESSGRAVARRYRLLCPNCGQQLPAASGQPGFPCPRCGAPMMYR